MAILLLVAAGLNFVPTGANAAAGSGSSGDVPPRLVVAGLANGASGSSNNGAPGAFGDATGALGDATGTLADGTGSPDGTTATANEPDARYQLESAPVDGPDAPSGPYLADGTLVMPVTVDTTVADGSDKLSTYRVRSGDTLTGIASHFGVSMMSIWWANDLKSKDDLTVGQRLIIPPVSGLVITVADGDTLDLISARTGVSADAIVNFNGLTDRNLIIGQTLIIPGGTGKGISTPKVAPRPAPQAPTTSSGGGGSYHPPATTYGGGAFAWPVPGGYISQYFHYSHPALDIAAPYGSRIIAAASGTVVFAGWKNNGGGYQVWISHGSGLYTGYYHMSAVLAGTGEHVSRGEQIGRIGMTGWATGPHCHFEVWRGYPWESGSYRVNPLIYL